MGVTRVPRSATSDSADGASLSILFVSEATESRSVSGSGASSACVFEVRAPDGSVAACMPGDVGSMARSAPVSGALFRRADWAGAAGGALSGAAGCGASALGAGLGCRAVAVRTGLRRPALCFACRDAGRARAAWDALRCARGCAVVRPAAGVAAWCGLLLCLCVALAPATVSIAKRIRINAVRAMGSTRRIESTISVRRSFNDFECLKWFLVV